MLSPTGIIPEDLMYPAKKAEVMRFLKSQPFPADMKGELLKGWALTVGQRVSAREMKSVERTGVDASYQGNGTYTDPSALF
jgi:hypothetical protein